MNAEETARYIRNRQRELAALSPSLRKERLAAELRRAWQGLPSRETKSLIEETEKLFPAGPSAPASHPNPEAEVPRPAASPNLEELVAMLAQEIEAQPEEDRAALRLRVGERLGIPALVASSRPQPPAAFKVQSLIEVLEKLKFVMTANPDPVLNAGRKAISGADIVDLPALVARLQRRDGGVSDFLRDLFSTYTVGLLGRFRDGEAARRDLLKALEEEFTPVLEGTFLYEEQRFAGVGLSIESRLLLNERPREGRRLVRFNQALLEDVFGPALKFQTTEREFIESAIAELLPLAGLSFSTEVILQLAASVFVELGCLDRFGCRVLSDLNGRVFDPVHGRLAVEDNDLAALAVRLMRQGDGTAFALNLRKRTGVLECLLYWYGYNTKLAARPLGELQPERLQVTRRNFLNDGAVDFEASWQRFKAQYSQTLKAACGSLPLDATDEDLVQKVNQRAERRVTTQMADAYDWKLREEE